VGAEKLSSLVGFKYQGLRCLFAEAIALRLPIKDGSQ
jgi:hypothetical protein